jgi:L-ascorbate metabolism protein UlaG (beta-lactamase superfamily)
MFKFLGKKPGGKLLQKILRSPNYKDGRFQNIEITKMGLENESSFGMIVELMKKSKLARPSKALPTIKTDLTNLKPESLVWFGHSSYLIRSQGINILVDPVFFNAGPFSFFGKPFIGTNIYKTDDLPRIDLLILTHDHYDHFDYKTVSKIKNKTKRIITSLGVSSHLKYWGFDSEIITELDWNKTITISDKINITSTSGRHFSGRLFTRNQTLWNSYVLQLDQLKIFLGGDSGYGKHFVEIGKTHGPFDLAILECGQYGKYWPSIHMFPEQTAKAAQELGAKTLMPVHWGKFVLSVHAWNEPVKRVMGAGQKIGQKIITPKIGENCLFESEGILDTWWDFE